MGKTSKDLLHLEHKNSSSSPIESTLLLCKKERVSEKINPDSNPIATSVPKSQVLGKVRDFLGVISEANKRLQLDSEDNSKSYDIEVLTGNESEVIEMDLMLGIADLHTPEAVAAAESAIAGYQPVIPLASSSGGSKSDMEDSNDDSDSNDDDNDDKSDNHNRNDNEWCHGGNLKRSKFVKDNSSDEDGGKNPSKKRSKIVEL